ncbi:MAG: glycoside hydrolase domain-containing protein, partial [Planctomycetota bacterium]
MRNLTWAVWMILCAAGLPAAAGELSVLGDDTYLRVHVAWKTDAARSDPVTDDWMRPEFDDRSWAREHVPLRVQQYHKGENQANQYRRILARAKFRVTDPADVRDLRLSVRYCGGAVGYLNGKEIARRHLPDGALERFAYAEGYPDEAYVDRNGKLLQVLRKDEKAVAEHVRARMAKRYRKIDGLALPADALREGVNVLAIEVHAAPVNPIRFQSTFREVTYRGAPGVWHHAQLVRLGLAAETGSAVQPNTVRPKGTQVWTPSFIRSLMQWDYGDPCEEPRVRLVGARNGAFSGWVVVSSRDAVRGVKVTRGELRAKGGATIGARHVQVRYAEPCRPDRTFNHNAGYDGLLDEPPAEAKPSSARPRGGWRYPFSMLHEPPVPGANAPALVTVHVPADAKPGVYEGVVPVEAEGLKPTKVPISITVRGWRVPDPADLVTHHNLYQSHESSALHYGVPLWSERHWELMGEVLERTGVIGNQFCLVNLIERAYHMGNSGSMVRWVPKKGGGYDHDFSIVDRYLKLYEAKCGKPGLLLLSLWQRYADPDPKRGGKPRNQLSVTTIDPKTKEIGHLDVPVYGTETSYEFWKPVLDKIRARLKERGWLDVVALGNGSDPPRPSGKTIGVFNRIWPGSVWMSTAHGNPKTYGSDKVATAPVAYREYVWG